jgi:hypothetical protein
MGAPASISFVSGPFSAQINTAFGGPFVAKVTDANGNPVSGVTVTFWPQGRDAASCVFAGGVNNAVTDLNGLATSAAVSANGAVGSYQVQAWVGAIPPVPGAVGPAIFTLSNSPGYVIGAPNKATILAAWTTAKAQLATVQADANTLAADLAALEATCDTLYSAGAGDLVDWLRQNARQTRLGYVPRVSAAGNPAPELLAIWAAQLGARDLRAVDQRPVTVTPTAQALQLS